MYDYKEICEVAYENSVEQGNKRKDSPDIALDFMYGLEGDKYSVFVAETINDIQKCAISQPGDIHQVFSLAKPMVVVSRG